MGVQAVAMAALDTPCYVGADDRQQILLREQQLRSALVAADPSHSGFVSKFDFRKALYVDAGLSYNSVSSILEDAPQCGGRVAFNLWFEAICSDQYPLREMLKRERRSDEELKEDVQRSVAASSDAIRRTLQQFDPQLTGFSPLYDFKRTLVTHLGLTEAHLTALFGPLGDTQTGFVNYSSWIRSISQTLQAGLITHESRAGLSAAPLVDLERFYCASNPALEMPDTAVALPREAYSRTAAMREQMLLEPNRSKLYGRGSLPLDLQLDSFRAAMRGTEQDRARSRLVEHS